jgi:small subunit ribosomal protein S20
VGKLPNLKSGMKHIRSDKKKHDMNVSLKSRTKTAINRILEAIANKDLETAQKSYSEAASVMDKAVKCKVLKSNTVSRHKSRLAKKINDLKKSLQTKAA